MNHGKNWTSADDDKLLFMRRQGAKNVEIAKALGRTVSAVTERTYIIESASSNLHHRAIARASSKLCDAINSLLSRMPANDVAAVLGGSRPPVPGTERIFKTASAERLAA